VYNNNTLKQPFFTTSLPHPKSPPVLLTSSLPHSCH
jgi:hypothetical protein